MNAQQKLAVRIQRAAADLDQAKRAFADLEQSSDEQAKHFARKRIEDAERRLEGLRI